MDSAPQHDYCTTTAELAEAGIQPGGWGFFRLPVIMIELIECG